MNYGTVVSKYPIQHVWVLYNAKTNNLCYRTSHNMRSLWEEIVSEEFLGTGHTVQTLRKAGWRAKRARIFI